MSSRGMHEDDNQGHLKRGSKMKNGVVTLNGNCRCENEMVQFLQATRGCKTSQTYPGVRLKSSVSPIIES